MYTHFPFTMLVKCLRCVDTGATIRGLYEEDAAAPMSTMPRHGNSAQFRIGDSMQQKWPN